MPTLSLCMIVRDEADMLPGFFAATEGLRDQFIAVDTGSRDDTVDLLREAGATVVNQVWTDDFSAARNASLEPATGDWILFLDADERPTPELVRQIRGIMDDPTAGAATIVMRNLLPHGHIRESDLLRLWRRDPQIAFRHRIHEEVATSVMDSLHRHEWRLVNLSGRCEHLGYARDIAQGRAKKQRDLALLSPSVAEDPHDWYSWYKLLELARFWNDRSLWCDTAQQVIAHLDGPPPAELPDAPWNGDLLALVAQGSFDDLAEQVAWLDRWENRVTPIPAFYLRRGLALEQLGQADRAERDFQHCRDLPAGTLPMQATVRPLLGLCRLAAQRGDLHAAKDHANQALVFNPRDPEALLAAVSFAWLEGGASARDRFVDEHRQLNGSSVELDHAVGDHALQAGLWEDAESALATAAGDPPRGHAAILLAQAKLARGRVIEARDLCRDLMGELPEAGMGYLACSIVRGESVDFTIDLQQSEADAALKEWIRLLWRSRQAPLMATFVDHFALVGEIFPWLPAFLTEQTERLKQQLKPG